MQYLPKGAIFAGDGLIDNRHRFDWLDFNRRIKLNPLSRLQCNLSFLFAHITLSVWESIHLVAA
jgi:hypothetical protein